MVMTYTTGSGVTADVVGYYVGASHGYHDAVCVVLSTGDCDTYATGPNRDEGVAELEAAGVPLVPSPFACDRD